MWLWWRLMGWLPRRSRLGARRRVSRAALPATLATLLGLAGVCGCGLSQTVERQLLRDLTVEQKLVLFEAENEVYIARDEREALRLRAQELERQRQRLAQRLIDAQGDGERAEAKGDQKGVEVAQLRQEVLQLQQAYLDSKEAWLEARLEVQQDMVMVARAKLELAKAELVNRANVRGADGIDPDEFTEQVDAWVAHVREQQQELEAYEARQEKARQDWLSRRDELLDMSGGAYGSPWAEEASMWGEW